MKNLLLYTTRHSSTEKCVRILQAQLNGETTIINLQTHQAPELSEFNTIILGGSIYMGKTQKELRKFAETRLQQLLEKPVLLFFCSRFRREDDFHTNFPDMLVRHARRKSCFGGELSTANLGMFERLITKMVGGKDFSDLQETTIAEFAQAVNDI